MIFETINIPPSTSQYVNGESIYTHYPQVVEGKGMYVKILTTVNCGDESILKSPVIPSKEVYFNTSQFPEELFLEQGEKFYITSFASAGEKVKIIHYNKTPNFDADAVPQEFQVNLTGLVSPK